MVHRITNCMIALAYFTTLGEMFTMKLVTKCLAIAPAMPCADESDQLRTRHVKLTTSMWGSSDAPLAISL